MINSKNSKICKVGIFPKNKANALKVDIRHKNNGSQRHLNLTWLCIFEVLSSGTDEHYTDIQTSGQI